MSRSEDLEGEETGDVEEEEELEHTAHQRMRRDLREEIVANSSSEEGKGNSEGEMVNTSGMFFVFGFDVFDFGW